MAFDPNRFVFDYEKNYAVREKVFSFSGDDFDIKDVGTGDVGFKVRAKHLTFHGSKELCDNEGDAVYKLSEASLSFRSRMHVQDVATGEVVYTLRRKGLKALFGGGKKIGVWKGGSDDGDPYLLIKGDFFKLNFDISDCTADDATVGKVSKELFDLASMFMDRNLYAVQVQPGYDAALFVLLGIVVDELFHDKDKGHGHGHGGDGSGSSGSSSDAEGEEHAEEGEHDGSSSSSSSSSSDHEEAHEEAPEEEYDDGGGDDE